MTREEVMLIFTSSLFVVWCIVVGFVLLFPREMPEIAKKRLAEMYLYIGIFLLLARIAAEYISKSK